MVGNYRNNAANHESRIRSWMVGIMNDGRIDRYDDLHIDRIYPGWKEPKTWISAGLQAFELALNIRDRERLPFSVVLGFSLQSAVQRREVQFRATADIENEFGTAPPSLYLFRPGQEPWTAAAQASAGNHKQDVIVGNVNPDIFGTPLRLRGCFYFEFKNGPDEEYSRSILLAG